jgi:hypothetical protein
MSLEFLETSLPLLAQGGFHIEPAERGDRESPRLLASTLVEVEHLWVDGIDGDGKAVQVDVLPCLPPEVRRAVQRQLESELDRDSRQRAEQARADEWEARAG